MVRHPSWGAETSTLRHAAVDGGRIVAGGLDDVADNALAVVCAAG